MKTPRTDKIIVVVGMSRRVYAHMCKKESTIMPWVERTFEKERYKAYEKDGCIAVGVSDCTRHGDLYEYHIIYESNK